MKSSASELSLKKIAKFVVAIQLSILFSRNKVGASLGILEMIAFDHFVSHKSQRTKQIPRKWRSGQDFAFPLCTG